MSVVAVESPTEYRVRYSSFEDQAATLQMFWYGAWVVACEIDPDNLEAWLSSVGGRLVAEAHGQGRYLAVERAS